MFKWWAAALQKYATLSGRARRKEYWYFTLTNLSISYFLLYIAKRYVMPWPYLIYMFATVIPAIAVIVRRMHDVGKSGWFSLIPVYNLVLACTEGDNGPNEYGRDPKRMEMLDEIDQIGNPQS